MLRLTSFAFAGAVSLLTATTVSAQTPVDHGAFLMRRGNDTIAVETFEYRGDSLRSVIDLTGAPRLDYVATLRPDLTLSALTMQVFAVGAPAAATPTQHIAFAMHGDSVTADVNGAPQHFAVAHGAVPLINNSWATMELLTRRARRAGGAYIAPVWALSNATGLNVVVTPIDADSMTVVVAGQTTRLRVDGTGRILGGTLPAQHIDISRVDHATMPPRAPPPSLPAGLVERDVTVPGPVPLPGVLTVPSGPGPFPGVVLVHGSGAGDRDETMPGVPNKPFRDIAWGLAQRGIVVLRYDKRPHVDPQWFAGKAFTVFDETIQDALSALTVLRSQPDVDAHRTFQLGHSLGGMLAPRIALADGKLAGIIIMGGATETRLVDQMVRQMAYIDSITPGGGHKLSDAFAPTAARLRTLTPADTSDHAAIPGLGGTGAAYWVDLDGYDPGAVMRSVQVPALVLQGMRDYQVPPDQLDDWLKAVGPRSDITVKRYPGLNHLFMVGTGVPSPTDYNTLGHVDAQVITDIAQWIKRQAPARW
jgi:hypothetical protein